ncbi:Scr1 family TA system antitoxin-like transcriptional regulator [Glycomyces artemisiae]|uniref:Helix-turn-helix protein n=1 Tax=Glycomyces artemisiae TaxID=1076443 RepID=A0A2T0UTG7_9ACTN|nr:Scr1 family TA system antitoxin-like transcriptional regulator [Glycomyces artemisiae]PRY61203.1 helix-turn-helix protein [Glycomyces artemisiae]
MTEHRQGEDGQDEEQQGESQINWFKRKMMHKYRTMRGLTQQMVSDGVYKSKDTIRAYERGRSPIPASIINNLIDVLAIPPDVADYLKIIAPLKGDEPPIEADGRFNALYLSLCEQYMGEIFEWAPVLIPAPLQTYSYYDGPACAVDILTTDERRKSGWTFRSEREKELAGRNGEPTIQYLLGEAAFFFLSKESRKLQIEQLDFLSAHDELPGWEIRVLPEPWINVMGSFSHYGPGDPKKFPDAGPEVVYTALAHTSWVFQDEDRIAFYDGWRHEKWLRSIRFKEYRDEYWRNHLA